MQMSCYRYPHLEKRGFSSAMLVGKPHYSKFSLTLWANGKGFFPLRQVSFTDMLSGNGTIFECDMIMWSAGCCNGEASYPISLTLFFCSRPMAHTFHRPKILDGGTLRSSISKVHTVFEILDLSFNLLGDIARGLHPFTHMPSTPFASVTLIHHGYIGASPDQPHLAFLIQLLAFYRQL